jgi:hypothetical protein
MGELYPTPAQRHPILLFPAPPGPTRLPSRPSSNSSRMALHSSHSQISAHPHHPRNSRSTPPPPPSTCCTRCVHVTQSQHLPPNYQTTNHLHRKYTKMRNASLYTLIGLPPAIWPHYQLRAFCFPGWERTSSMSVFAQRSAKTGSLISASISTSGMSLRRFCFNVSNSAQSASGS